MPGNFCKLEEVVSLPSLPQEEVVSTRIKTHGVTVALQFLVLSVKVRILMGLQRKSLQMNNLQAFFMLIFYMKFVSVEFSIEMH